MESQLHGRHRAADHWRVTRAASPELHQPVPALISPLENANQVLSKVGLTMNRGGSAQGNPILKGLGVQVQHQIGIDDELLAVYLFQDHANVGLNLAGQVTTPGPGVLAFDFVAGFATTVAGNALTGAKRNFLRFEMRRGGVEREFWIKERASDIVTVGGFSALDPTTLLPVDRNFPQIGGGTWLTLPVDFTPSWGDEFLALHRGGNDQVEPGFQKAYGGAYFVSFFDEVPGVEGTGVAVEPISNAEIRSLRQINVQNTPGLKKFIARFRSAIGSLYFVDCPVWIQILAAPTVICNSPKTHTKDEIFIECGEPPPPDWPGTPGAPAPPGDPHGPPPAPWGGGPVTEPLVLVEVHASSVGGSRLGVRRYKLEQHLDRPNGAKMVQVGADQYYTTMQGASAQPPEGAPYAAPVRHRIAIGWDQLKADNVAMIEVWPEDDTLGTPLAKRGVPIMVMGPKLRDIGGFPIPPGT